MLKGLKYEVRSMMYEVGRGIFMKVSFMKIPLSKFVLTLTYGGLKTGKVDKAIIRDFFSDTDFIRMII